MILNIILSKISGICFRKNKIIFINFLLIFIFFFPVVSFSQDSDEDLEIDPVTPLTEFIKYSKVSAKNNLSYAGKVFGFVNGESFFEIDYEPLDTFSFETENYDSIQFFSEFTSVDGKSYILDGFFLKVKDNKPFEFEANPIMKMSGADLEVANNQLKKLFTKEGAGEKLYVVSITDDVNPDQVEVTSLPEAALYIDVLKIDSSSYQIKLKDKKVFYNNLSDEIKRNWKRGDEIKFPIGINLKDTVLPEHTATIQYFLVKKMKPKKINN